MASATIPNIKTFTSRWCQCPGQEGYVTESDCPICSAIETQEPVINAKDDSGKIYAPLIVPVAKPVAVPVVVAQPAQAASVNILPWLLLAGAIYLLTKD